MFRRNSAPHRALAVAVRKLSACPEFCPRVRKRFNQVLQSRIQQGGQILSKCPFFFQSGRMGRPSGIDKLSEEWGLCWSRRVGVEALTCRLRIVRTEGAPRNPNHLQSYQSM
jgi:hypothetical protein